VKRGQGWPKATAGGGASAASGLEGASGPVFCWQVRAEGPYWKWGSQPVGLALSPAEPGQLSVRTIGNIIGLSHKLTVGLATRFPQTDRGCSHKLTVDKPQSCKGLSPALTQVRLTRRRRLATGGGLLRRIMPRLSSSVMAPRYWVSTMPRVLRKIALKWSIRP
jgi:hypothetical protein